LRLLHVRANGGDDLEERVALLAAQDLEERVALPLVGPFVDNWDDLAVALVHRAGPLDGSGPVQSGQVDVAKVPFVDPHRHRALAVIMRRKLVEVAWTARVAIAVLEPGAFHVPIGRHARLLCLGLRGR